MATLVVLISVEIESVWNQSVRESIQRNRSMQHSKGTWSLHMIEVRRICDQWPRGKKVFPRFSPGWGHANFQARAGWGQAIFQARAGVGARTMWSLKMLQPRSNQYAIMLVFGRCWGVWNACAMQYRHLWNAIMFSRGNDFCTDI